MTTPLYDIVHASRRVVFFGGAGVSTESGIPDFRSADGLYNISARRWFSKAELPGDGEFFAGRAGEWASAEEILSRTFFEHHPREFYAYYSTALLHPKARPNAAHHGLAALERQGKLTAVITQNIDGLHQAASSRHVLELHGSVHRNYCVDCRAAYGLKAILEADGVPCCPCGGIIRPDVVLYEEPLDSAVVLEAQEEIALADTLIVGGTSLAVQPAAWLALGFRGKSLVVLNRTPTSADRRARLVLREPIGEILGEFMEEGDG